MTDIDFTPHPGSRLDAVNQANAHANPDVTEFAAEVTEDKFVVLARSVIADTATYRTITLDSNNPFLMVIPQDPQRARATVIASTATVYLAENRDLAMVVNGGGLGSGAILPMNVNVPLLNQWEVWAVNSAPGTPATLTVIVERYADCSPNN